MKIGDIVVVKAKDPLCPSVFGTTGIIVSVWPHSEYPLNVNMGDDFVLGFEESELIPTGLSVL